mgnify:CR=1 FL=1
MLLVTLTGEQISLKILPRSLDFQQQALLVRANGTEFTLLGSLI